MQEILDSPDQDKRIQLPDSHPRGEWLYLLPGQQDQQTAAAAAEPIEEDHNPDPADPHPFSPFIVPTRIDKEGASPDTPVDSPTTPDGAEEEEGDLETLEAVPMEGGDQHVASVGGDVGQDQDMEAQAEDGSEGEDIRLQAAAEESVSGTVEDGSAGKDMGMDGGDGGACKDEGDDKIDKGVASTEHHILDDLAKRILTRADQDNLQYPDGKPRGRPRGRKNGSGKKSNGRGRGRGRGARKEKASEKLEEPEHKKPTRAPRKPKEAKKLDFEQAVGDNSWSLVPGEPGQEGGMGSQMVETRIRSKQQQSQKQQMPKQVQHPQHPPPTTVRQHPAAGHPQPSPEQVQRQKLQHRQQTPEQVQRQKLQHRQQTPEQVQKQQHPHPAAANLHPAAAHPHHMWRRQRMPYPRPRKQRSSALLCPSSRPARLKCIGPAPLPRWRWKPEKGQLEFHRWGTLYSFYPGIMWWFDVGCLTHWEVKVMKHVSAQGLLPWHPHKGAGIDNSRGFDQDDGGACVLL